MRLKKVVDKVIEKMGKKVVKNLRKNYQNTWCLSGRKMREKVVKIVEAK